MRNRYDPMEMASLMISGDLVPEDDGNILSVLKDVLNISKRLRAENRKLKNRRGSGRGPYMTKQQLHKALDSLYADEAEDGDLLSDVLTHLESMQEFPYRLFMSRYIHARFLCRARINEGYGLTDVVEFARWLEEVEGAHDGQEQSGEAEGQEAEEDHQAEGDRDAPPEATGAGQARL